MLKRLFRAFVFAVMLASGLLAQTVRAASNAELLGVCYTFPGNITVCCDAGGCYIKSAT